LSIDGSPDLEMEQGLHASTGERGKSELQENRIKLAVVCLQISAIVSLLAVIFLQNFLGGINSPFPNLVTGLVTGVALAFTTLTAVLAFGLQRRKRWAWNVSVGLFALYVASGSVLLGAVGLWGLLDVGSRREFGVSDKPLLNI
jgi:hypothetical protein